MFLNQINTNHILFLDIETIPAYANYSDAEEKTQELWTKKSKYIVKDDETAEDVWDKAGIYAEFGKIVCISVGFIVKEKNRKSFRIKSFFGKDEQQLLFEFKQLLDTSYSEDGKYLCAHNGKEFDYPYIARRMLINGISLPKIIDIAGKKPWEIRHLDTLELWKFGDYKHFTSIDLLTHIFKIPGPKDDIDGSQVAKVFYKEDDIKRIVKYCEKDVLAVAQLFLKYRIEDLINPEDVISATVF